MAKHSSGQTIFSLAHIEGITLGAGEEVDEIAGGACGMSVDRIGEVGDRESEKQAAQVYGAGFKAGSLAGKRAKCGMRGTGKVSSDPYIPAACSLARSPTSPILSTPMPVAPSATSCTSSPAPSVIPSMWGRL